METRNNVEALFFTDKQQVYKVRLAELEDGKVAQMGIYLPGRLGMDEGESILSMVITSDYGGYMLFFFASGKCAKIPLSSYAPKQNRRKDHPRQPGCGRRDPEKEPDHRLRRPGGYAGTGEPPPLPRPQPAGHRRARPRGG